MHIVTRATTLFVLALIAANAKALSYECEIGAEVVYQEQPCEGVNYAANLTKGPSQAGTNVSLPDLLVARGQVQENIERERARKEYEANHPNGMGQGPLGQSPEFQQYMNSYRQTHRSTGNSIGKRKQMLEKQ